MKYPGPLMKYPKHPNEIFNEIAQIPNEIWKGQTMKLNEIPWDVQWKLQWNSLRFTMKIVMKFCEIHNENCNEIPWDA